MPPAGVTLPVIAMTASTVLLCNAWLSVQRIGGTGDPAVGVVNPDGTIPTGVFADVVLCLRHAGSVHVPVLVLPSRSRSLDGDCS
jgi:hypothetical protein